MNRDRIVGGFWLVLILGLLIFSVGSCAKSAITNIGNGFNTDMNELTDYDKVSSKQIDPENPLRGILSPKGIFSNTGEAISDEGQKVGNGFSSFFEGLFILIIIVGVVAVWLYFRSSNNRKY